jgi:hypothetical protein
LRSWPISPLRLGSSGGASSTFMGRC